MSQRKEEKRTYKIGDISEARFISDALSKGFIISKPFGNSDKYDFILDSGKILYKVQVKTANFYDDKKRRYVCSAVSGRFGKSKLYSDKEVDIVAIWVPSTIYWYIIPTKNIDVKTLSVYPHYESKAKYEKFKNAWELLK